MKKIKILITDDVEDNRYILEKLCRLIGNVETLTASNGQEAVEIVKTERPQIVLMDIMMPVMDGFEATRQIRQIDPEIVVIVVTALDDADTESKMIKAGAHSFITKPFDFDVVKFKLLNFITIIENRRHTYNLSHKVAINPFSNEIRSMKTFYFIQNETDMMDFGSWLMERFAHCNATHTFRFDAKIGILYKIITAFLEKAQGLSIIIEDGFDNLYISFSLGDTFVIDPLLEDKSKEVLDDIIVKNNHLYLKIRLNLPAETLHNKEASFPAAPESVESEPVTDSKLSERLLGQEEKEILRKSYTEKITASDYVATLGDILYELQDLEDIEKEWHDSLHDFEEGRNAATIHKTAKAIAKYSVLINSLYDFMALSYSMSALSLFLENLGDEQLDEGKVNKLHLILSAILSDLENWRHTIFISQDALDIHYLDTSIFSSCLQAETILMEAQIQQEDEEDIEFF